MTETQSDKTVEEIITKALHDYQRYLNGPVPSRFLYGDPDVEPYDVIRNEAIAALTARENRMVQEARADELTLGMQAQHIHKDKYEDWCYERYKQLTHREPRR